MVGAGSMAVQKSKNSTPDHLNKLMAGTLKDEVEKRERKKMKEKIKEMYSDRRRFVFSATSSVDIRVPPSPEIR